MSATPRYRFAPSPTGYFHVGGARTALYNWLLALKNNGTFVLRIEDTDESRNEPQWTQGIIDALAWIGIDSKDPHFEGPYFQSTYAAEHVALLTSCLKQARRITATRRPNKFRNERKRQGSMATTAFRATESWAPVLAMFCDSEFLKERPS